MLNIILGNLDDNDADYKNNEIGLKSNSEFDNDGVSSQDNVLNDFKLNKIKLN